MKKMLMLLGLGCLLSTPVANTRQCSTSADHAKGTVKPLGDFSIQLYHKIAAANPDKNIVFSPVSVALALALLEQGAAGTSKTELDRLLLDGQKPNGEQFYEALQSLLKSNHENVTLNIANGLFIGRDFTFKQPFTQSAKCYKAEVRKVNFGDTAGAAREINAWASNATNQRIPNLLSADALANVKAVLTNAIYLKAAWEDKLNVMQEQVDFYRFGRDNDKQRVTFIRNQDKYGHASDDDFDVVAIPYVGGQLLLYIVLPKQRNGLQALELTAEKFRRLNDRFTRKEVDLRLPRFSIRTSTTLTESLKALGLNSIFSESADLSALSEQRLKVDSVVHEAFIKVNENGTEAAAVTAIKIVPLSMPINPPPPTPFIVDHPFLFAIVHHATKAPLFLGKVNFVEDVQ